MTRLVWEISSVPGVTWDSRQKSREKAADAVEGAKGFPYVLLWNTLSIDFPGKGIDRVLVLCFEATQLEVPISMQPNIQPRT